MAPLIVSDPEIERIPFRIILDAVRAHVDADYRGEAGSPPRNHVALGAGGFTFTTGGDDRHAGFRVYDSFPLPPLALEDQVVAVWDVGTRRLKGLAIGEMLGALRTGALGGVAIERMAPAICHKLAVIGTGLQARTQMIAAMAVRRFSYVSVYSRDPENCRAFAERMQTELSVPVHGAVEARLALEYADVVILATSSREPVIETAWLKPGAHVSTIGPKFRDAHEMPLDLADAATWIASDSPQQIGGQGERHMLHGRPCRAHLRHLGEPGRSKPDMGHSLFLSAGLAGTEVKALAAIVDFLNGEA
jgi:ornithine cyclodeaminase